MCIALISTAHPAYELIIIDNRDVLILAPCYQDKHTAYTDINERSIYTALQRPQTGGKPPTLMS